MLGHEENAAIEGCAGEERGHGGKREQDGERHVDRGVHAPITDVEQDLTEDEEDGQGQAHQRGTEVLAVVAVVAHELPIIVSLNLGQVTNELQAMKLLLERLLVMVQTLSNFVQVLSFQFPLNYLLNAVALDQILSMLPVLQYRVFGTREHQLSAMVCQDVSDG